jgi:hypothetical protein
LGTLLNPPTASGSNADERLEARVGIEPTHQGFADPFLATPNSSDSTQVLVKLVFRPLFVRLGYEYSSDSGKVLQNLQPPRKQHPAPSASDKPPPWGRRVTSHNSSIDAKQLERFPRVVMSSMRKKSRRKYPIPRKISEASEQAFEYGAEAKKLTRNVQLDAVRSFDSPKPTTQESGNFEPSLR